MRDVILKAALIMVVFVLGLEILYGYRSYTSEADVPTMQNQIVSYATDPAPEKLLEQTESTVPKIEDEPEIMVIRHRATLANSYMNSTYLDEPRINGAPKANLIVTQNWNPRGKYGVYNDHEVGVWYNYDAKRWAIYNQDRTYMPEGASFVVLISTG